MKVKAHEDGHVWKDWWISLFLFLLRVFARRVFDGLVEKKYVTYSVFSNTAYYFKENEYPSADTLYHEQWHGWQYLIDGLRMPIRYIFSQKWRIRYETQAYHEAQRYHPGRITQKLTDYYFLTWDKARVLKEVEDWIAHIEQQNA